MVLPRGCTPRYDIAFDYTAEELEKVEIVFVQNKQPVLTKTKADMTFEGTTATFKLTQAETLQFSEKGTVEAQLRWKRTDGEVEKTAVFYLTPDRLLDEKEL